MEQGKKMGARLRLKKNKNQPKQELLGKTKALPTIEPFTNCLLTTEPGKPIPSEPKKAFFYMGTSKTQTKTLLWNEKISRNKPPSA